MPALGTGIYVLGKVLDHTLKMLTETFTLPIGLSEMQWGSFINW